MKLSSHQMLAVITRVTGDTAYTPRPYENLLLVHVSRDKLAVKYERFTYKEMASQTRLTSRKVVIVAWSPEQVGSWTTWRRDELELPDDSFTPRVVQHFSKPTPQELLEKSNWEDLCYRPGDGSRFGGRDSLERATQDAEDHMPFSSHRTIWSSRSVVTA